MGILLGQLPPAEIARLKAELAETLIANFCYPRFYDYRTDALRMRPVDRTKRQEVWLYLSSIDFTAWNRVDLMSPDFQRYIEHLFVQFVKRNRSFFGQQGRKRMPDIRTLISSSATSVTEGLRGHLTGRRLANPPFGSPRPVNSWSTANVTGRPEPNWEQIMQMTMLLQQQMQEVRAEIKTPPPGEARPAAPGTRRITRARSSGNGASNLEHEGPPSQPTVINIPAPKEPAHTTTPLPEPKYITPFPPLPAASSIPTAVPPVQKDEDQMATPTELPVRRTTPPRKSPELGGRKPQAPQQQQDAVPTSIKPIREVPPPPLTSVALTAPIAPLREVPPLPPASVASTTPTAPLRGVPPQPQASVTPPPAVIPAREVPPQTSAPVVTPSSVPLLRETPPQLSTPVTAPPSVAPSREAPPPPPVTTLPAPPIVSPREVYQPVRAQASVTPPPMVPAREAPQPPAIPSVEMAPPPAPTAIPAPTVQPREVAQVKPQAASVPARKTESAPAFVGNEDVAIFEQLRHQLIVWLRIEAVRSGADISGMGPTQLLELLRQQETFDETRLQVVSTLLTLSNQVITSGHASLLDYKQCMMFYLMHTRR